MAAFVSAISTCAMPLGQALYGVLFQAFQARVWVVVLLGLAASLAVALTAAPALTKLPGLDEAPSGGYTEESLNP